MRLSFIASLRRIILFLCRLKFIFPLYFPCLLCLLIRLISDLFPKVNKPNSCFIMSVLGEIFQGQIAFSLALSSLEATLKDATATSVNAELLLWLS